MKNNVLNIEDYLLYWQKKFLCSPEDAEIIKDFLPKLRKELETAFVGKPYIPEETACIARQIIMENFKYIEEKYGISFDYD